MFISVTRLASKLGMATNDVNPLLEREGFQTKEYSVKKSPWVPTEKGQKYCDSRTGTSAKGEPYTMLLWDERILKQLIHLAPPTREEYAELQAAYETLKAENARLKSEIERILPLLA